MKYSTKAGLKAEIANSHLSWMWWFLDPICFMVIYTFIAEVVFARSEPYFPVYVGKRQAGQESKKHLNPCVPAKMDFIH